VETFLTHTARNHRREIFEPLYFLFHDGPLAEELRQAGAKVFLARSGFRLRRPGSFWACVREISRLAHAQEVDLVHSSMAYAALLGAPAARLAGRKHLWFQHGPVAGWMDWLAALLPSERVFFNSRFTLDRQLALQWIGARRLELKSRVIHLGTQVPPFRASPADGKFRLAMLCRAQAWKGADLFVEAIRLLGNQEKFEARLYLAPADPAFEAALRVQAAASPNLRIEPPVSSPEGALSQGECVVNASRAPEPFGLTLIEAMAHGMVPIAPRAGGPLEILEEGKTGFFFAPGDAADLAAKIRELSADRLRFEAMRKNAYESARTRFSMERMMGELESCYEEILRTSSDAI
jgi:glycosyltransferase involved in cell wall biosynthesis